MHADFRRCLDEMDVEGMRQLWRVVGNDPQSSEHTMIGMHYARTAAASIAFRKRAWSHAWLMERGLPSGLPDELKPRAERLYPQAVTAVGISVNSLSGANSQLAAAAQQAMSEAVAEMYEDGISDPVLIKPRMVAAYRKVVNAG